MLVEFLEKHGGGYSRQGPSWNVIHSDIIDKAEHALGSSSAGHGNPGKCYVIVHPVPGKILKMANVIVRKLILSSYIQRLLPLHRELHHQEWAAHAGCVDVSAWAQEFILNHHGVFSLLPSSHRGRVWVFFSGICISVAVVAFLLGGITLCHHAKSIWVTFKRLWKPEQQNEVKMEKRSSRKECLICDVWAQLILFSTLCLFQSLFFFISAPSARKRPFTVVSKTSWW